MPLDFLQSLERGVEFSFHHFVNKSLKRKKKQRRANCEDEVKTRWLHSKLIFAIKKQKEEQWQQLKKNLNQNSSQCVLCFQNGATSSFSSSSLRWCAGWVYVAKKHNSSRLPLLRFYCCTFHFSYDL